MSDSIKQEYLDRLYAFVLGDPDKPDIEARQWVSNEFCRKGILSCSIPGSYASDSCIIYVPSGEADRFLTFAVRVSAKRETDSLQDISLSVSSLDLDESLDGLSPTCNEPERAAERFRKAILDSCFYQ